MIAIAKGSKKEEPDLSEWPPTKKASDPTPDESSKNQEGSGGRWSDIISDDDPK